MPEHSLTGLLPVVGVPGTKLRLAGIFWKPGTITLECAPFFVNMIGYGFQ
jgi:hypothetical protein